MFYIIHHPRVHKQLTEELEQAFPGANNIFDHLNLASLPYLNAVIEESLRLGTPFPGLRRVVPQEGAMIDRHFVPGGTVVGIPGYSQQLSEENFYPDPLAFLPERWLEESPENICRRAGLLSFSFGTLFLLIIKKLLV